MIFDQGSGREQQTGAYIKQTVGPQANQGTVYVVAGNGGDLEPPTGHHPAMFTNQLSIGSVVLDINSNRLDAQFLLASGSVGDTFTIIKKAPEPLRISAFFVQDGYAAAQWPSVRGLSYQVEQTDDLETPNWNSVGAPVTAIQTMTSWTNAVSSGNSASFYRVVQLAP
jgi:hypothetical protein